MDAKSVDLLTIPQLFSLDPAITSEFVNGFIASTSLLAINNQLRESTTTPKLLKDLVSGEVNIEHQFIVRPTLHLIELLDLCAKRAVLLCVNYCVFRTHNFSSDKKGQT